MCANIEKKLVIEISLVAYRVILTSVVCKSTL